MRKIFDMDNPLMQILAVAADLLVLNLLTILCSLPILTAGAALAALCDQTALRVRGEDPGLLKSYFRSFAAYWKKGTLLWLLLLAAAGLLYFDYLAALVYAPLLRYPVAAIAVLVMATAKYAFPLLTRFDGRLFPGIKNAAVMMVAYFPRTLGMVVFAVVFWMLAIRYYQYGVPLLLLFGLSLPCYVNALLLRRVFDQMEN